MLSFREKYDWFAISIPTCYKQMKIILFPYDIDKESMFLTVTYYRSNLFNFISYKYLILCLFVYFNISVPLSF